MLLFLFSLSLKRSRILQVEENLQQEQLQRIKLEKEIKQLQNKQPQVTTRYTIWSLIVDDLTSVMHYQYVISIVNNNNL